MSPDRRLRGTSGRVVWIVLAVVVALLLGASFVLMGRARDSAETEAEIRAERYAVSGLLSELSPELVARDISGTDYRGLLSNLQSGFMTDPAVVRVRVWKPDGNLIFSTAARDDVESFEAVGNPQILAAADGQTGSVVADASAAPLAGLEGSEERLFVTYVPLQFAGDADPSAVAEIDQRYATIEEEAGRLWRPVQIGLGVALVGALVLFGLSFRRTTGSSWAPKTPRVGRDERRLHDAEDRAINAERAAKQAEERLAESERRVAELEGAEVPPAVRAKLEELELKLRAEQAEREQFAGEAKRLKSALTEREAELALVRDRSLSSEAERARSIDAVKRAEQQTAEAEKRAAAVGTLVADAEARASAAESKVVELEIALRDADRRLAEAVEQARREAEGARREEETRTAAELRGAQLEGNDLRLKLSDAEARIRDLEAVRERSEGAVAELANLRARGEEAAAELARTRAEGEVARNELEELRLEVQRARLDLESSNDEADRLRIELQAARAELEAAASELAVATGERDRAAADLDRLRPEAERLTAELEAATNRAAAADASEVQRLTLELDAARHQAAEAQRLAAELEAVRRESAEVERLTMELEAARREADEARRLAAEREATPAATPGSAGETELRARLEQMESQRRSEVAELHRAQESLANMQVELMEATRKLRASQERVRELEAVAGSVAAGGPLAGEAEEPPSEAPEPERVPERRQPPRREPPTREPPTREPPTREPPTREPVAEPAAEEAEEEPAAEPAEETLSLRERLARAAAARHRTTQPPE